MDLTLNNEIKTKDNLNNNVDEFMQELKKALEKDKNEIIIDEELYNYIYNELDLAPKYQEQLESIIKQSLFDYSSEYNFLYLRYDKKDNKYYVDCYDGEEGGLAHRVEVTKKDIEDAGWNLNTFYCQISKNEVVEDDAIKDAIIDDVALELKYMEEKNKNAK